MGQSVNKAIFYTETNYCLKNVFLNSMLILKKIQIQIQLTTRLENIKKDFYYKEIDFFYI